MSRSRLLLVEPDPHLLRSLQILLEDDGDYEVVLAPTTADALARLDEPGDLDVVLCELAAGEVDGWRILEGIRRYRPSLPVLVMTAHPSGDQAKSVTRRGAHAYLAKPIDPPALLAELEHALHAASV